MRGGNAFGWVVVADIAVIDEPGNSREQSGDHAEENRVERRSKQQWCSGKKKSREVEQQTQNEKADWKMDQHDMLSMLRHDRRSQIKWMHWSLPFLVDLLLHNHFARHLGMDRAEVVVCTRGGKGEAEPLVGVEHL